MSFKKAIITNNILRDQTSMQSCNSKYSTPVTCKKVHYFYINKIKNLSELDSNLNDENAVKHKKISKRQHHRKLLDDSLFQIELKLGVQRQETQDERRSVSYEYDELFDMLDFSKKIHGYLFQVKEFTHQIELRILQQTLYELNNQNIILYLMQIGECMKLKALIIQLDQIDVFVYGDLAEIKNFLVSASTFQTVETFLKFLQDEYKRGGLKFQFAKLPLFYQEQSQIQCELYDLAIINDNQFINLTLSKAFYFYRYFLYKKTSLPLKFKFLLLKFKIQCFLSIYDLKKQSQFSLKFKLSLNTNILKFNLTQTLQKFCLLLKWFLFRSQKIYLGIYNAMQINSVF